MNTGKPNQNWPEKSAPHFRLSLYLICLVTTLLLINNSAFAQNINDGFQTAANDQVRASAVKNNGAVLIGGRFTQINGLTRNRVAQLNPDGSLSSAFHPDLNGEVIDIAIQEDGKIILAGGFTEVGNQPFARLARFFPDGTLDKQFQPEINSGVWAVKIQNDGKIVIGGQFTQINGEVANRIARLLPDGNIDTSFNPGLGVDGGPVYALALQTDKKIIVGGTFSTINGEVKQRLGRLYSNGSLDMNFNNSGETDGGVLSVHIQADKKIVVGGFFEQISGRVFPNIARFNLNGSLDLSFSPDLNNTVNHVHVTKDNKILVAGAFSEVNGVNRSRIALLNTDGNLNENFGRVNGFINAAIETLAIQSDDKIIIGGFFSAVNGEQNEHIARLYPDGQPDTTLNPSVFGGDNVVNTIAYDTSGNSYIGGDFTTVGFEPHVNIAKLSSDGSIDSSFVTAINGPINAITVIEQGSELLIGGEFTSIDGVTVHNITRIDADGIRDPAFSSFVEGKVNVIIELANDQFLIGGFFDVVSGLPRKNLVIIDADGSVDTDFTLGTNSEVCCLALQDNGRVIVGGSFDLIGSTSRNNLARFQLIGGQGFVDTFNPNPNSSSIRALKFQADNKLLVTGTFSEIDGEPRRGLARLIMNSNNNSFTVDNLLDLPLNVSGFVNSIAVQANDSIILGGNFTSIDGVAVDNLTKIFPNPFAGNQMQVDTSFGISTNNQINALALMPDGKIMLGGFFTEMNGLSRLHLARLSQLTPALREWKLTQIDTLPFKDQWETQWVLGGSYPQPDRPPSIRIYAAGQGIWTGEMQFDNGVWKYIFNINRGVNTVLSLLAKAGSSTGQNNGSGGQVTDNYITFIQSDTIFKDGFDIFMEK
ncbi:delta-60 repeat domain-containing protein [Marinicella sp. W31]|uniref:delta-60 repeat domain-containing protein n=1 Tax=Marinicella sp. W31 TaxID=3023713 RepID=UPI0037577EE1